MATYYVRSGATGLNDGSSWTNAWTSIASADAVATSSDEVWVAADHVEGASAAITLSASTYYICKDHTDDSDAIGAQLDIASGTFDVNLTGGMLMRGFIVSATDDIFFQDPSSGFYQEFHDCEFYNGSLSTDDMTWNGSSSGSMIFKARNCLFEFGHVDAGIRMLGHWDVYFEKCTFQGPAGATMTNGLINDTSRRAGSMWFYGCDLTKVDEGCLVSSAAGFYVFDRCLLPGTFSFRNATWNAQGSRLIYRLCQTGTDSDPAFQGYEETLFGFCEVDTARYRTGGASDGERTNPYSFSITSQSYTKQPWTAAESMLLSGWTDGDGTTSHTYRVYFASGATLTDRDLWADFWYPNDAAANSLAAFQTKKPLPGATGTNHTTDSGSTWNGTDVTTKQYLQFTATPDKPGPIQLRVFLSKPTERVSVDPKIYIDP